MYNLNSTRGDDIISEERGLQDIKNLFVEIRFHAWQKDESALKSTLHMIEKKRAMANNFENALQRDIFIYCFDSLKTSIEEQRYEFAGDFADAVHNLPEVFCHKWILKNYWKLYIMPLREKHGNHFFDDFRNIFKMETLNYAE